jgi:glycosidase
VQLDFWIEAKRELHKVKDLFWLGELDALEHPEYMQVFDAAYTWTWMHKTEQFYKGQLSFTDLMQVLQRYKEEPGIAAWFTTNHDENSWNGTEYEKYGAFAKALAVFSCTWPGLPLVYSGQELPNFKRLQFFEKDEIEWGNKIELHHFYKPLFELRKNDALATDASVSHIPIEHTPALVFMRSRGADKIGVAINFSAAKFDVEMPDTWMDMKEVFSSDEIAISSKQKIVLLPWGFSIFKNNTGS